MITDTQLKDFIYYLFVETQLKDNEVCVTTYWAWIVTNIEAFVQAVKGTKLKPIPTWAHMIILWPHFSVWVDISEKEDRDFYNDLINWVR